MIGALAWGAQAGSALAQATGLVAAYAFNEASGTTTTDSSGNNNTGTLATGVTRTTQGRYGSALVFNGTTGRVTANDAPSLRLASAMTLEAWVNPSAVTSVWRDVIYKGDDNYYLEATSFNGSRPGTGGTFGTAYGTAALAANTWTHLAVTYDRVTIRLYVNGTQVSTVAATAAIATSTNPLQIGSDSFYGQYFQGSIDEVRIYNRVLTAAEIQTDMNTPVAGAPADTTAPTAPTSLSATAGTGAVSLSWGAATDNVGVTLYNVHRSTTSGFSPAPANRISQVGTLSFVDSMPAGTYYYVVTAQDAAGNVGPPSNEAAGVSTADTQPPTAPGNLVATAVTGQINLSWTASADNIGVAGYRLERCQGAGCASFAQIAAPAGTNYGDAGLAAVTSYSYRVRAVDAAGNPGPYSNVASATTPAASSGLVAAYAFNEASGTTTTDSSGNDNAGTLGTGVTRTTQGRYGSALVFNGTTGRVTVNDAPSLRLTSAMTLEAWVNPSAVTSAWRDVIYKGNDNYYLEATSMNASRPGAGGTFGTAYGTAALAANTWTHLAVTYDRVTMRLYVNGAQASAGAATAAIATSTNPLQIGSDSFYGQYFQGSIDDVRVYNRVLTPAQIQTDMNTPVASGTPPPDTTPPSAPTNLAATPVSSSQINLTWTASTDNVGVTGYRVFRAGTQIATTTVASYSNTGLAASTLYTFAVAAVDAAGNVSALSASAGATTLPPPDTTPPQVSITFPAPSAQVAAIVTVTANATDNVGVAGVQFRVDGVDAGAEDTVAPYAFAWDTRTAPNGAHTLAARARDAAGNATTSAAITVNVSNSSYFQNEILLSGLNLPTNIEFLPDGRMYIGELGGKIWILQPGATAVDPTPFLQLTNIGSLNGQQGLMDLVFDPAFATNRYYYVFYTLGTPNRDRVSRFTANANATATVSGSELVLYQDPVDANAEHHGGALNFGNDGKLYITTGDHFTGISQDLTSARGKILRINKDGTIPTDNPFYDGAGPNVDSVWARGLRNPFRAFYDGPSGRFYVADVGGNVASTAKEELNVGAAGANYGWPDCEGPCGNPAVTDPIYWYPHNGRDAAITGGFIYRGSQYPSDYYGNYFFADYAQNWIRRLTFDASGNVSGVFNFEPIDGSTDGPYGDIVYLTQGPDGALYYVDLGYSDTTGTYGISKIRRIRFIQSNLPPVAAVAASPTEGPSPLTVTFSSAGSSDPEGQALTYAWTFGDGATSTAANPVHTYTARGKFTVRLSVSDGVNATLAAPLTIAVGNPPTATILTPADGIFFRAGDVISFSGEGSDPEDGTLPPSAFTWAIDFLHEGHVHPGLPQSGVFGGTFTIPTSGHDFEGNTRYRISLTVTDSDGLTATQSVLVYPEKVNLSFATTPAGLTLYLDGVARTAPFVADTLVNFVHTIDARTQAPYAFASWSDGGAQQHSITAPAASQSYTATFTQSVPPPPAGLVAAWGFNEGAGTTTADASPNGNLGTLVNGPVWTVGRSGGGLQFDGVDDRVRVNDSNSLDLTTAATFEAWVYPTVAPAGWRTILQKEVDAYFFTASSESANRPGSGGTFNGNCCAIVYAASALPVNTWTHVAATYDGGQLRFFVNGTQVGATIVTGSYQVNSNPLWIGGNAVYGEHFQGRLDDLRIYNRALTAAEIQQDMATPVP